MNQQEVTKLVTYIEENLRASSSAGLPFVDSRHYKTRLMSKQNHAVFGRRGAGKTSLVHSIRNSPDHLDIYLNLEDYKDITFPNIIIHILLKLYSLLDERVRAQYPWYKLSFNARRCKSTIRNLCQDLRNYLHEPDAETQEVNSKESCQEELHATVNVPSASAGAKTKRDKSLQVKRSLPKNKLDYLRLELTTYKELIDAVSDLFSDRQIFLILDDFYFISKDIQPDLIDYFHRMTKGTPLFLKLATIKHRSKMYRRVNDRYTGVELGHDIFEVDMDYSLDNFDELQLFMRQLLDNAIIRSEAKVTIDEIFAGDGFSQLCLASGGVPRDFLWLFVPLANRAASTCQPIGKMQVTEAAISNIGSKIESMKKDSGDEDAVLHSYLSRIKKYVYDEKRTNAFLIAKDDLDKYPQVKQAIRELVDLRLVHMVDQNTSKAPSDGRRYEAYILDIGLYENSRPRNFTQVEPGQRDDKSRKDNLRATPVFDFTKLFEPRTDKPTQLLLGLSEE